MVRKIPLFFLAILLFDLLVLFLAYSCSKAKISKNTEPIISSIAALSEGKSISLSVNGELSDIALKALIGHLISSAAKTLHGQIGSAAYPMISRQSIKIKELVQDLNLVSKLEYEMQPLEKQNIRLSKLLRSYAIDLINSGLPDYYSLEVNISPDAENTMIECDSKLITRAVTNLVQNSIHSNPKGCTVTLLLQITENKVLLTVRDNGIGIPAEKMEELISKPHYMDSLDDRLDLCHGLGLFLVRQIIEAHHGTIEVESRLQEGYATNIYFPCGLCPTLYSHQISL